MADVVGSLVFRFRRLAEAAEHSGRMSELEELVVDLEQDEGLMNARLVLDLEHDPANQSNEEVPFKVVDVPDVISSDTGIRSGGSSGEQEDEHPSEFSALVDSLERLAGQAEEQDPERPITEFLRGSEAPPAKG